MAYEYIDQRLNEPKEFLSFFLSNKVLAINGESNATNMGGIGNRSRDIVGSS